MKEFKALYRRYVFKLLSNPFTYFSSIVFVVFTVLHFFVTQNFFKSGGTTELQSFFSGIPYICIIIIPAISAIIGSSKAEYSYPGNSFSLPLAKILASLTCFLFYTFLTLFLPAVLGTYGNVQLSQVFTGYFVIILYALAVSSLSIFLFACISSPGLAFVVDALVLAVINSSHLLPMYFSLPPFISWLCKEISFAWHFDAAGKGILDTRDLVFYAVFFLTFLCSFWWYTESRRGNKSQLLAKKKILIAAGLVLLFIDGIRVYVRLDTTRNRQFSVTAYSKDLMKDIKEPLSITYYRSPVLNDLYPSVRDVGDFLELYADESPYISFSLCDPSKKKYGKKPEFIWYIWTGNRHFWKWKFCIKSILCSCSNIS